MPRTLLYVSGLSLVIFLSSLSAAEPLRLIAHRGGVVDEQRIENNRRALDEAARRGYWMVEADIQRTKDGVPIVHHDRTFERYYGDPRPVGQMDWEEIAHLRSTPGEERPLKFSEFAAACQGRLLLMLDIKGDSHPREFYEAIESALAEHGLLESAYLIGSDQSKEYFRGKLRVSGNVDTIAAAAAAGVPVSEQYFLFDRGSRITETIIERARELNVPVVAGINRFRYPDDEATAVKLSRADITRLRALGVTQFQIDSQYDVWLGEHMP
ncbi:MAG: hypothetical protein KF861_03725 [Planctomycetaceae bacterium]|nr:hypothetical protein [Planctomycetaceae bacterium]